MKCSESAIQSMLPSNARVVSVERLSQGGTFEVPESNIAYPVSPTGLRSNCAVHVNVTSSDSSAFGFGMFLPDEWNERSLSVGNGGFAGGVNWLDMVGSSYLLCRFDVLANVRAGRWLRVWLCCHVD